MPALTRRREPDRQQETWHIYYGDTRVGSIGERAGVPVNGDQWGWRCGFYPVERRGGNIGGTAATFEEARGAFEAAWQRYLPDAPRPTSPRTGATAPSPLGIRPYADPDKAARKLLVIAFTVEAVQDGRIHIEKLNGPMLFQGKRCFEVTFRLMG